MNAKDLIDILTFKRWLHSSGPTTAIVSYQFRPRLEFGHSQSLKLDGADILDYADEFGLVFKGEIESTAKALAAMNGGTFGKNSVINHNRFVTFNFKEHDDAEKFRSELLRRYPEGVKVKFK